MPIVQGHAYGQARDRLSEADVPDARLTITTMHKDVTLPTDYDEWRVCEATPASGTRITSTSVVVLKIAAKIGDCDTSYHGYLHQKNDPAYTQPKPEPFYTPQPAKTTSRPAGTSMITCPNGKSGYACTSNGKPVVDGQFCPKADRGRTLKATNGTMVTCSYDPSVTPYRWQ